MICVLSLLVFSFLGIFSATHRELAKESFECLKNRAQRQPCNTGLDDRVQASIVGKVLEHSPKAAKLLNKYFELFSWAALILLILSGLSLGMGVYNYTVHGNCNGPNTDEGCAANTIEEKLNQLNNETNIESTPALNNTTEGVPG